VTHSETRKEIKTETDKGRKTQTNERRMKGRRKMVIFESQPHTYVDSTEPQDVAISPPPHASNWGSTGSWSGR